ncbi:O-antigen polymerase [Bacillus sp. Marseille-P3800]|uniref:O-antigen polymerase n=1 Tax=Bacillus sp. Marseille-P3800 TaxID=2014782 RepID=UPI000C07DA5F|nr:O-antigen polymerase [Bacillus sp. Marseille-P3800]
MLYLSIGLYMLICALIMAVIIIRIRNRTYISPLTYVLFIQILLPFVLIFPFSYSDKNIIAVGEWHYRIIEYIPQTLLISSLGTLCFLISYFIFSKRKVKKLGLFMKSVDGIASPTVLYFFVILSIGVIFLLNNFSLTYNSIGIRNSLLNNPLLSPIYNFISSTLPLLIGLLAIRFWRHKNFVDMLFLLVLLYFSLLTGSRTTLFSGALFFILAYFANKQHKIINLVKLGIIGTVLIAVFLSLSLIRSGTAEESGINFIEIFNTLLYGNTFSDFRDTAWLLSGLDNVLLYGKTYISAMFSFIPSSLVPFREEWSLGIITTSAANLDSSTHPGLRPVIFGEAFINFGYIGVIIISTIYGAIISYIDKVFLNNLKHEDSKIKRTYVFFVLIFLTEVVSNIMVTAGFFYVYVVIIMLIIGKAYTIIFRRNTNFENYNY